VSPLDDGVVTSRFGEQNNSFVSLRAEQRGRGRAQRARRRGHQRRLRRRQRRLHGGRAPRCDVVTTVYTNLQPPVVAVGDAVSGGQVVGYLGGSSFVPPDVLRFYVRSTNPAGTAVFVDPGPVLGL
jgi:murein DD-endopeptidase MepM/ murein hydrolase activator NlpD